MIKQLIDLNLNIKDKNQLHHINQENQRFGHCYD